ncbi:MAG: hypothetical protein ACREJD_15785 [Phycisphaerales bacterium]
MLNHRIEQLTIAGVLAACVSGPVCVFAEDGLLRSAVTVMTPNSLEGAVGNSPWYMGRESAFSVQVFVAASQLTSLQAGFAITGMSFRSSPSSSGAFPLVDVNMQRFDVTLSPSVFPPNAASSTFAANIGPGAVNVRSGSMLVPANAFPATQNATTPSLNNWYVPFTNVYVYPGGDLCVTFRAKTVISSSGLFDGLGYSPTPEGSALYNYGDADGTDGSTYGPLGIRFSFASHEGCDADLNFDKLVDDADFIIFVAAYNILDCADPTMPASCVSDVNNDQLVDDADFVLFLAAYNELVCP